MASKIQKSPSNSRLHGRLEALEDVVEVEEEPLEAHEVRKTPLDTKIVRETQIEIENQSKNHRREEDFTTFGKS